MMFITQLAKITKNTFQQYGIAIETEATLENFKSFIAI